MQLTSPESNSTEDKYWELKKTTGSEMQVRSDQGPGAEQGGEERRGERDRDRDVIVNLRFEIQE
jgi:hypothetical protein